MTRSEKSASFETITMLRSRAYCQIWVSVHVSPMSRTCTQSSPDQSENRYGKFTSIRKRCIRPRPGGYNDGP